VVEAQPGFEVEVLIQAHNELSCHLRILAERALAIPSLEGWGNEALPPLLPSLMLQLSSWSALKRSNRDPVCSAAICAS
jgi:hypothetical protein